jgi:hypothetical protein
MPPLELTKLEAEGLIRSALSLENLYKNGIVHTTYGMPTLDILNTSPGQISFFYAVVIHENDQPSGAWLVRIRKEPHEQGVHPYISEPEDPIQELVWDAYSTLYLNTTYSLYTEGMGTKPSLVLTEDDLQRERESGLLAEFPINTLAVRYRGSITAYVSILQLLYPGKRGSL